MSNIKVVILLSFICLASVSASIITPALVSIEKDFSLGYGQIEWVVSIFLIGYVLGQLFYGPIANRFGRLNALRTGMYINLIGIVICYVASWQLDYSWLLFGRLISAFGAAAGLSCTFILINELLDVSQARVSLSYTVVSFTLGNGIAVLVGGLITQYFSWQNCFVFLFVHGAVMLVLTWQFKETLKNPQSLKFSNVISGYFNAAKSFKLIAFSFAVGVVSTFNYCYATAAPVISQLVLGLSPAGYAYWNIICILGMLFGGYLAAKMQSYYTPIKILIISFFSIIPFLISLILMCVADAPTKIWFFTTAMFIFVFMGTGFSAATYIATNAIEDRANSSSLMSFINMGTSTLAVIIMGYLPFSTLQGFVSVVVVTFILVALLVCVCIKRYDILRKELS